MKPKYGMAILLIFLGLLHLAVFAAGFLSPYDVAEQDRELPFAPPTRIHFADAQGASTCDRRMSLVENSAQFGTYDEDTRRCFPIRFFVYEPQYNLAGVFASNLHLLGVDPPARLFLMGTDAYGRDLFSRFLHGGQISLAAGSWQHCYLWESGSVGHGVRIYGGWLDAVVMRFGEIFIALPWLYLLFALRAFLPLNINPSSGFSVAHRGDRFSRVGPSGTAYSRDVVLSGKERHYVLAARMFGGSGLYLMRRHILPQTYSIILTQAVLLIPQYILAEVTLSFLGLGVGEPEPSWGNMLASVQQYHVSGFVLVDVAPGYRVDPGISKLCTFSQGTAGTGHIRF